MRHLLVMLFVALGFASAAAAPASASSDAAAVGAAGMTSLAPCQRDSPPLQEALEAADVVVSGTVVKRERDPRRPNDFLLYTIRVDRVYAGSAPRLMELRTPNTTDACGLTQLERNRDYVIAAHEARGRLTALSTDGSGRFAGPRRTMVLQMFGDGNPPTAPDPTTTPESDATAPKVTRTSVDDGGAPSFTSVAWPGWVLLGGGVLVFALGLLLGRRPQS